MSCILYSDDSMDALKLAWINTRDKIFLEAQTDGHRGVNSLSVHASLHCQKRNSMMLSYLQV